MEKLSLMELNIVMDLIAMQRTKVKDKETDKRLSDLYDKFLLELEVRLE